jgi:hypothetical protein
MATWTYLQKGGAATGGLGVGNNLYPQVIEYDFSIPAATAGVLGTAATTGDIYKLFTIPAYTIVLYLQASITTALGTGTTAISIGDSSSAATYVSAYSTTTTGAITMAATSKYYNAADYIDLTLTGSTLTAGTAGNIHIIAVLAGGAINLPATVVTGAGTTLATGGL